MNFLVIRLKETDSTNNYLKELIRSGDVKEGTVIRSEIQTSGRGQQGNRWESEEGKNLLFSIVLYPNTIKATQQFIISQLVSLAVKHTLDKYTHDITIKWPNDIYWQEKKICGILIENTLMEDNIGQSVIGAGININQDNFITDAPNPISLKQITGAEYDMDEILESVYSFIMEYYSDIRAGRISHIIEDYKSSLFRNTGYYLYDDGKNIFGAKIKDIRPTGLLVLETRDGIEREFAFKEVKYIL